MARAQESIRIPRLRAFALALAILVVIGLLVFLQRYRGADRTAMALSVLGGAGLCLVAALIWFQRRWSGRVMTRLSLWGIGLRTGAVAGVCTSGVGVVLLALRWAIDQRATPAGELLLPAFFHALGGLGTEMARALPAYLGAGAVVGALVGLVVAEAIGVSAERIPPTLPPAAADAGTLHSSNIEK
jgi:hypothetical protein